MSFAVYVCISIALAIGLASVFGAIKCGVLAYATQNRFFRLLAILLALFFGSAAVVFTYPTVLLVADRLGYDTQDWPLGSPETIPFVR